MASSEKSKIARKDFTMKKVISIIVIAGAKGYVTVV